MFSSSHVTKQFTTEFLRDVNTNPKFVDYMKTIGRSNFHTMPMTYDVNTFVDFIYNYIDYKELIKSPHATEWHSISVKTDCTKEEYEEHIKSQIAVIVKKIITKQFHNEKVDNTFSSFIKRIICNVIGDVCGGFRITDLRPSSKDQVDPMQYIRENKHTYMREYIHDRLFKNSTGGFVVCLENDHGCVFSKSHLKDSSMKNLVYKRITDEPSKICENSICYLQLGDCKGNQAKGIYYTGNYTVDEVNFEDIQQNMNNYGFKEHAKLLVKYKDRFSVCCVRNNKYTDYKEQKYSFWYKKKYFIIVHNKSVGTKKDIKNNAEEYACMRKLIDSYATSNNDKGITKIKGAYTEYVYTKKYKEDVFVLGDFNIPLWGKDNGYLKLEPEDRKTYPIQEVYEGDHETFMTKNLELYSTWNNNEVGFKDRSPDWMQNSQAGIGKRTIPTDGPRNYHTDMVFGNIELYHSWKPTIIESKLYPEPWYGEWPVKMTFPLVSTDLTWFSDHQSMEMTIGDNCGKDSAFTMVVLNTLSDCCSGQQHMKRSFNKKTVENIREEFAGLLVEYIHKCTVFDVNVIDEFQKTFNKGVIVNDKPEDDETNLPLGLIITHTEYNFIKALVATILLNYILWTVMAITKWLFTNE